MAGQTANTAAQCNLDPIPSGASGQLESLQTTCCSFSDGKCERDCKAAMNGGSGGFVPTGMSKDCYDQLCPWLAGSSNAKDVAEACGAYTGTIHVWILFALITLTAS